MKSSPIVTESAVFTEPSTATRYIHGQVAERIGIGRQMIDIRTKQFLRRKEVIRVTGVTCRLLRLGE